MKAIILGKEIKNYKSKEGEEKVVRNLHVMWEQKREIDGFTGNKVESVFVPFDIPAGVDVGVQCEFEYELQTIKNNTFARLVDITPLLRMRVTITPDVAGK